VSLQDLGRYPASIEAALYYCCTEALENAAKHGGPDTTATITARGDDKMITLTVSDTGRDFDTATIGTGLTNMRDRLAAIGGTLVIDAASSPVSPHLRPQPHQTCRAIRRFNSLAAAMCAVEYLMPNPTALNRSRRGTSGVTSLKWSPKHVSWSWTRKMEIINGRP
jgi:hypothetical protein